MAFHIETRDSSPDKGVASPGMTTRFSHRGSPELEATLRRMVVIFRFLGMVWMAILVAITLAVDPPPTLWIVWASFGLAVVWTLLTWYMARGHPRTMSSMGWLVLAANAMLAIGAAP